MPLHSALTSFLGLLLSLVASLTPAILGLCLLALVRPVIIRGGQHRVVTMPAIAAGMLLGIAALAIGPLPPMMGAREIFTPGGAWDMTGLELISQRLPEALDPLHRVIFAPLRSLPTVARIGAVAFMGAVTLAAILPFLASHNGVIALRIALNGVICAMVALATVYLACLFVWMLGLLSYWVLVVLLVTLQRWRYADRSP